MHATYNDWLVILSIAVAVFVSHIAFRLAARVRETQGPVRRYWLVGGAIAMGIGIWSTHFIGMLAVSFAIALRYDVWKTLSSLALAIAASGLALNVAGGPNPGRWRLALGGSLMSAGVLGMHYLGMAAIDIVPTIHYRPALVGASVVIAVAGSWGALWLPVRRLAGRVAVMLGRLGAALVMGLAISGTHYVGMAASVFAAGSHCHGGFALDRDWFALTIALIAVGVLALTLVSDVYAGELAMRARSHAGRLEQANAQLRHQATHDGLTGLPNRQHFFERLTAFLSGAAGSAPCALMVIDLDRFKRVNDSLGHTAGDELLREVAHRLTGALRSFDTAARMGGDEFLVLLPNMSDAEAVGRVAGRIIQALAVPMRTRSVDVLVTPSIGISVFPRDGADANSLLARADEAMYCAKRRGGNSWQCFAREMSTFAQERLLLESDLRQALDRRQFELHYQPRVDVVGGGVRSVEALIRWRHPRKGYVPPANFIPLAEESGLIGPIGEWVLREACRQGRAWQLAGLPMRVAVNISALQFRQPDLIEVVREALDAASLPAHLLELELTESAVMTDPESSIATLQQLSRLGVVVALDDFGTGYSNMSYLLRFPIDRLKIDASFVRGMTDDPQSLLIVRAIVSLTHSLRMKVIAEGVETQAQLEQLKLLGCDQCQGYLFGRPAPAGVIEEDLRARAAPALGDCPDPTATVARLAHAAGRWQPSAAARAG